MKAYTMTRNGDRSLGVVVLSAGCFYDLPLNSPRHSPAGFEWGYAGSGPAELARQILWDHLGSEPHPECYQAFKQDVIAVAPREGFTITGTEIESWMAGWAAAGGGWRTVADYRQYQAADLV